MKKKRLLWEFSLYSKFTCTDKNNNKSKTNFPLPRFHSSYSFLNCWKAVTLNIFILSVAFILSGLFCIANLLEMGRAKAIFSVYGFEPTQNQNIPIINIKTKVFLWMGHWNWQKTEKQRKRRTKVYNLTKTSKN